MPATRLIVACLLLGAAIQSYAQPYVISTYAGGAPQTPTPAPGLHLWIGFPQFVAADRAGNVYFTSTYGGSFNCVFKLDTSGVVTRVAGTSRAGFSGDGGPATDAQLNGPVGLTVDAAGNLFIADTGNVRIRKVSPDGIISTVAGNGTAGFSGDGGPATDAQLGSTDSPAYARGPVNVAVDRQGNLFIADSGRVRRVSPDGIINTVLDKISGPLAADAAGNLFVANNDYHSRVVMKLTPDGTLTTVAGGGKVSGNTLGWTGVTTYACLDDLSGDGGPATQAGLCPLTSLVVDDAGNLFIGENFYDDEAADNASWALRKVSPDGTITTAAGNTHGWAADGGPATAGIIGFGGSVAEDRAGNLFITDDESIRRITPDGTIDAVAGRTWGNDEVFFKNQHFSGDGGPATSAVLSRPYSLAVDWSGNLFIADGDNRRVRKVTPDGIISTVAGGGTLSGSAADGGPATDANLALSSYNSFAYGVLAVDGAGNLFIKDGDRIGGDRIRRVSPDGIISTVAGGGTLDAPAADGGPATKAHFTRVTGIAGDASGNLYIAEPDAERVRKVTPDGIISTFAGTGVEGPSGDGGLATRARLASPFAVATDASGNVFIADGLGQHIRQVTPAGFIYTIAGNGKPGPAAYGDGGPATSAVIYINGMSPDNLGNLFVASASAASIREIASDGIIDTIAGWTQPCCARGYSGDGGPATQATFADTFSVAVDLAGNVYVADTSNNVVRVLRPVSGRSN